MTYSLRPVPPAAVVTTNLAALTSAQQDTIVEGTLVTTSDTAERWQYTGSGAKTSSASYVLISDTTPDWSTITGRPSIPTAAPAAGQIMAGNAGGTAFATVSVSGDATLAATGALTIANNAVTTAKLADNSVTSAKIANGTITNDDMFANAAIGLAKLANLPSGQVVVGNAANVPTATAISGDATLSNTGALTISAGAIGTSKLGGDITAAGKALLDDANTAAQRSTLGLGNSSTLNVGTTTGTVAAGDDSRLSDARTPTAHTHGNISNTGTIGSTAGLPVVTTTSGALATLPLGTAGQALVVNSGATALEFATPVGGVTSVTGTSPIASSGGATPAISIANAAADGATKGAAAFNANDFNSASGVISLDYTNGQSASASDKGFLTSADWTTFNNKTGGSVGSVDNAVPRADGTGGFTVQGSNIVIDDATTSTQNNVAITNQHAGQTNSALVLTPKGTGAFILGPKPDGTSIGGNARGSSAVDLQQIRGGASQVASGFRSFLGNGNNCTSSNFYSACVNGDASTSSNYATFVGSGRFSLASGSTSVVCGGGQEGVSYGNTSSGTATAILGGLGALADRYAMQAHSAGRFAANGDAQRARFVMLNKTTTDSAVELFLTIPSGKSVGGTIQICGTTSGGETANLYIRQFLIRNRGGTTALIGSIQTVGTDIIGLTVGGISLTADDTNDALAVSVTGFAPVTACTTSGSGTAAVVNKTGHGFSNNDDIVFTSLTGGAGLTATTVTYWVINATANTFQVSATRGGAAVNITTNYTDMTATRLIRWVANVDCTEIGHGT